MGDLEKTNPIIFENNDQFSGFFKENKNITVHHNGEFWKTKIIIIEEIFYFFDVGFLGPNFCTKLDHLNERASYHLKA